MALKKLLGFKELYSYGNNINSYDIAKFLAIVTMMIDHLGIFIFPQIEFLRGLGRLAFPLFFFLVGYSNDDKRSWNWLLIGIALSAYKALITGVIFPFDILITLFISKLFLRLFVKFDMLSGKHLFATYLILIVWHLLTLGIFSYGTLGIMFAICGYLIRSNELSGSKHKYTEAFILLTIITDYFMQRLIWPETENFKYIFMCVSVFLLYYFMNFKMKVYETRNDIVLFLSRNSLFVYWLHYLILVTLSVFIFPERYVF